MQGKMNMSLKELMDNQAALRQRVLVCLCKRPLTLRSLAQEMAINSQTVTNWLRKDVDADIKTIVRVFSWLESNENV